MTDHDPQPPKFLGRTLDPRTLTYCFADGSGAIPDEVAQEIGDEADRLGMSGAFALLDYIAARKAALGTVQPKRGTESTQ